MYNYFVQVILNNNSKSTDRLFTYAVPEKYENIVQTGKRVKVSFGRNKHMIDALVVSVENSCDLPEEKLKEIMDVLDDEAVVSDEMIKLSFWMRERYICKYSDSIRLMIPSMIQYKHNIRPQDYGLMP